MPELNELYTALPTGVGSLLSYPFMLCCTSDGPQLLCKDFGIPSKIAIVVEAT